MKDVLFLSIGFLLIPIFCLFWFLGEGDKYSPYYPVFIVLIVSYIVYYWIANRFQNKKISNWGLRPSYICLFSLIIVNLQFYFDQAFWGTEVRNILPISWINQYLDKCFFGGCIFIIAYLMSNYATKKGFIFRQKRKPVRLNLKAWLVLQFVFFALFLINIDVTSFLTGAVYTGSGAYDVNEGLANSFERIYRIVSLIVIALYTYKMQSRNTSLSPKIFFKEFSVLFWIPFCFYIILRLFSGDRGPVIYSTLSILYSYLFVSRKIINLKWSLAIIVAGAFMVTLLGLVRSRSTDLYYVEKIEQSLEKMDQSQGDGSRTFSPYTQQLAVSLRCNMVAIRDIENDKVNFSYGKYSFLTALSSFPGAKKKYFEPLGLEPKDFSSAVYLTQSYNGTKYYTYGIGSSAFAEAYLDFGILGVILVGCILGYLYKCVDLCYLRRKHISIIGLIILLKLSSIAIYVPRASLSHIVGEIASTLIIYWIFTLVFRFFKSK